MGANRDSREFSKFRFESQVEKNKKFNKGKAFAKLKVGCESISGMCFVFWRTK